VNITGGESLTLHEVNEAVTMAQAAADPDANIIFGSVVDERMGDEVKITVIATGFAPQPVASRAAIPRQAALPSVASVAPARREAPAPAPAPAVRAPQPRVVPARAVAQPAAAMAAEPVAAPRPRAAPARTPRVVREAEAFQELDEDQYDIPAFLRRGGHVKD
jgi:cell division protein FtsZ